MLERSPRRSRPSLWARQGGVTLIEVLVAVLITAVGVLGAASMQLNAVKFNQAASFRSTAVFLANDIIDRMRANRALALNGQYDIALDSEAPGGASLTERDLREWLTELARRLPSGDGEVAREGSLFTITVQWSEARLASSREPGDGDMQSFRFTTGL